MKLTLDPGTLVAERFRIERFIAEGGMGEVYEATDEVLGESIALKFLSQRNIDDEQVQRRFRREIQLARKVTHPNVCRLYDVFQHATPLPGVVHGSVEVTFVTMELLEGETLEDRIANGGAMSEEEALPIVVQMCHALAAAHDVGIVHRDFKSNNVMLVPADEGRVRAVVTDFGLARSMYPGDPSRTPLTADQLILGTADYMAPEQITGDPVSPRSDVYALGVVMFEMLTGRKPYTAPNPMQLLVLRVSHPPTPPRDFVPDISEEWESVILQCIDEDPKERPASPRDIVRGLELTEAAEIGLGISDPSGTGTYRDSKVHAKGTPAGDIRQWWKAAGVATGIVLAALVAFLAARDAPPPDDTPSAFSPRRITSAEGLEIDPALSPNGDRLAYSAEGDDGRFRLYLRNLAPRNPGNAEDAGTEASDGPVLLTPTLGDAFEAAWSPEGDRLAFHVRGDLHGLWMLPMSDGSTAELGSPERLLERGARPSWSPSGELVAFQSLSSPQLSDTSVPALDRSLIEIIRLKGRETETVTRPGLPAGGHASPVWTPDGRFIVFNSVRRFAGELWAVEVTSDGKAAESEPIPIVAGGLAAYDPVVSPDGRFVYFVSRTREVKVLWRQRIDRDSLEPVGAPQEVAGIGLSSIRQPTVSKNGRLVFSAFHTRSNLWQVRLDPATGTPDPNFLPSQLTRGNDRYNRPAFSPDGRNLAFDHWKLGVEIDVFVQDLESGTRTQLSEGLGTNSHPSWLADGRVAFTEDRDGAKQVVAVDPSNGSKQVLATLSYADDWGVVSPDGTHLAYYSEVGGSHDIWLRTLPDGTSWAFTQHDEAAAFPVWSPDGRWLAYQVRKRGAEGTDLWVQSLDGGEAQRLVWDPGHSWPYSFSPDSRRVAYAAMRNGSWNLWWVDRISGERHQITHSLSSTTYLRYPLFSPYGTSIVYEQAETLSDLYAVELD
ncbi:MAG: protein kinase [Thermoanaerobaculia bacterium]|nr:protein kinase [Thermoanaerobaculia bacterium]